MQKKYTGESPKTLFFVLNVNSLRMHSVIVLKWFSTFAGKPHKRRLKKKTAEKELRTRRQPTMQSRLRFFFFLLFPFLEAEAKQTKHYLSKLATCPLF